MRREFFLPNFFSDPAMMMTRGPSRPVSDIALPRCGDATVMLLAERGGVRNLGLVPDAPFAFPNESRLLRYERDASGVWRNAGRSDIGFYDRPNDGQPYLRAACAGGTDFGYGYLADGSIDLNAIEAMQWTTGDRLCSPLAPCVDPATGAETDDSDVTGLQGNTPLPTDELMPAAALEPYPVPGPATPAITPRRAYMIDANGILDRNDATKVGDIAVLRQCPGGGGAGSRRRLRADPRRALPLRPGHRKERAGNLRGGRRVHLYGDRHQCRLAALYRADLPAGCLRRRNRPGRRLARVDLPPGGGRHQLLPPGADAAARRERAARTDRAAGA